MEEALYRVRDLHRVQRDLVGLHPHDQNVRGRRRRRSQRPRLRYRAQGAGEGRGGDRLGDHQLPAERGQHDLDHDHRRGVHHLRALAPVPQVHRPGLQADRARQRAQRPGQLGVLPRGRELEGQLGQRVDAGGPVALCGERQPRVQRRLGRDEGQDGPAPEGNAEIARPRPLQASGSEPPFGPARERQGRGRAEVTRARGCAD
mmetsp:Transcript_68258/g.209359  ORF Transcript_68258/g.209359 Transcript_68258/m.209359 type:complete len:203 (-) Transcript_68258:37-645(-)